jgi:hypothetical protein
MVDIAGEPSMHLWHLGFHFQSDVPEMLITGHERELITCVIENERPPVNGREGRVSH